MAELIVYPDAHPEVSSIDGRVDHRTGPIGGGSGISWADLVAGAGTAKNDVLAHLTFIYMECGSDTDRYYHLIRGIFLFDTSPLPDNAQIISATLSLYGVVKIDAGNWLPDVNIYAAAPASNKALEVGDFDSLGSIPFCDTPIGYNDWNIAGYNDFVLNADGLAAISKTGVTKFGARNANYDVAGVAPTWQETFNLDRYAFTCYCAEQGDGFKPKLTITYIEIVAPTVTTNPATDIEATAATLKGTLVDDGGEACQVRFQYGLTDAYGTDTAWQPGKVTGNTFEQLIGGLTPNTTYHFRAQAKNSAGTASGADRSFATLVAVPTVTTEPATDVVQELATLKGTLDNDGGEACQIRFQYGLTDAYGTDTAWQPGKVTGNTFEQLIGGLTPNTTYHFRAQAKNSAGTASGGDRTFTTLVAVPTVIMNKCYALAREEL